MLTVAWRSERLTRGQNGLVSLLVAGYLLGQGVYLLVRQFARRMEPARIKLAERVAAWDPSLKLGTRFGLHRYLENCVRWASEDPTARTQSLALFKVRGLGWLNETRGTLATTSLLQNIAADIRGATLPDTSSVIKRWLSHYFPRPIDTSSGATIPPRYCARWTGSTFALAFRELDAVQAVTIARDAAAWIRSELEAQGVNGKLGVTASVALGIPGATARGLATAALKAIQVPQESLVTVVHDPDDVRSAVVGQMSDVTHLAVQMERSEADGNPTAAGKSTPLRNWLTHWGPAAACISGAFAWLQLTGGKVPLQSNSFAWPATLDQVQVVDSSGSRVVRLQRKSLPSQSSSNWRLEDILLVQGEPADGAFPACQVYVSVTNQSRHSFYVSAEDFAAIDASGRVFPFDPLRMLRFEHGIAGRWLNPGDKWSGWLLMYRRDAPVMSVTFEPDRSTRLVASVQRQ
jgi:GGDEF domain-containing protein